MRISNALINSFTNATFENEALEISTYVATAIDNNIPLSVVIQETARNLGYAIHPESFFTILNTLIINYTEPTLTYLKKCDDMGFYSIKGSDATLKNYAWELYGRIPVPEPNTPLPDSGATKPQPITENSRSNTSSPEPLSGNSRSASPSAKSASLSSEESRSNTSSRSATPEYSSDSSEEFHIITVSNETTTFDNASNLEHTDSNALYILGLTIAAFAIIQLWAWYDRTYNRTTEIKVEVNTNDIVNENSLHSVHEHMFTLNDITYKLFLSLVPSFIITLYSLRYYYYYKYFFKFKK